MPKGLTCHHILLYEGDFYRLRDFHPHESPTSVVRTLVREHLKRMAERGPSEVEELKEFV